MAGSGSTSLSWLEKLKETLNLNDLTEKFKASKGTILDCILYLGIGFITSYILKKYGQYVLFFVIALFVLAQLNILNVDVNWHNIQEFLGLQHIGNVEGNIFTLFWEWVKLNVVVVLSFCVGFLLGLKVG
jgi:uncharacterized membrane protein (Fun14 family)